MNTFTRLALIASLAGAVVSAAASEAFEAGNRAYEEGKFTIARERYQAALESGEVTANVYYNLGNADAQIGAEGLAMLNYERALALNPSHHEARANLKFLRDRSTAKVPAPTWWSRAFAGLSLRGWLITLSIASWLFVFLLLVPKVRGRRLSPGAVFTSFLAAFATIYASAGVWYARRELNAALVVAKQVEARRAPADRAELADVLPVGSRIRWLNERSGWVECELPDGSPAWVPQGTIERIRQTPS